MLRRPGSSLSAPLISLACVASLSLAACTTESQMGGPTTTPSASPSPTAPPVERAELTYGVFGVEAELEAYQVVVDDYNARATTVEVTLQSLSLIHI